MPIDVYKQIKEQLNRKYELIVNNNYNVSDKTFFVGVADYVAISSNVLIINKILSETVLEVRHNEQHKLEAIEAKAMWEVDKSAFKLTQYLTKHKITNATLKNAIAEYGQLVNGQMKTSSPDVEARFHRVREIAEGINALGGKHEKYIKKYLIPAGDGVNTKWNFSDKYYEYEQQKKRFDHESEIEVWGSWNELTLAFNAFFRSQEIKDEYEAAFKTNPGGFFEYVNWAGLFAERDRIMSEPNDTKPRIQFKRHDYLHHLWRVHSHLLDQLNSEAYVKEEAKSTDSDPTPDEVITVKGLFSITDNPPRFQYLGSPKPSSTWVKPRGKTQPYAVLFFVAEKYRRNTATGPAPFIKLSLSEIMERLNNAKYCNKSPNWQAIPTAARQLGIIKKNITAIMPFTDEQLVVEKTDSTAHLVFHIS